MQNIIATNDLRDNAPAQDHQTKHPLTGCALDELNPAETIDQAERSLRLSPNVINGEQPLTTAASDLQGGLWRIHGDAAHFVGSFGSVVVIQGAEGSGTSAVAFAMACSVRPDASAMGFRSDAVKALYIDTESTSTGFDKWKPVLQWRVPGGSGEELEVYTLEALKNLDGVFEMAEAEQAKHGGPVMVVIDKASPELLRCSGKDTTAALAELLRAWAEKTKNLVVVVESTEAFLRHRDAGNAIISSLAYEASHVVLVRKTKTGEHFAALTRGWAWPPYQHIPLQYNGRYLDAIEDDEAESMAEQRDTEASAEGVPASRAFRFSMPKRIRSFTVISPTVWTEIGLGQGSEVTCSADRVSLADVGSVVAVFTEDFAWKVGRLLHGEFDPTGKGTEKVTIQADGEPEALAARSVFLVKSIATDFETYREEEPGNDEA